VSDVSGPGGSAGWSALHGGIALSPPVRAWLWLVQRLAAGPVTRVPPDVLSLAGVLAVAGALAAAAAGGRWPLLSALLVVAAGVLDGLDGAVALRTGRARPLGAVVDAAADRVGDLLLIAVLAALGAPLGWVLAAGAPALLHEYVRARAQAVGMPGVGAVTVAERPTRLIVVAVAALGTGTLPAGTPFTGWGWATVCAVLWTVAGVVGALQLAVGIVRSVPRGYGPDR
jgi:CDP-diacylglycerol--glycerol-3-phosphate 3-phosphatidyltransferase